MTCIVGVTDGTEVVLGGDSAGVSIETRQLEVRANRKVFRRQDYVFGYSGSFRMGQILRRRKTA